VPLGAHERTSRGSPQALPMSTPRSSGHSEATTPQSAEPDALCPERDRPYVLVATILASSMAFVDANVVHIALPAIQADLGARFSDLQWIVNGYTLMLGALLLAGGALGDQIGRRRVFASGIALFAAASIACAVAPSVP
jgi:sugar phosphate permease